MPDYSDVIARIKSSVVYILVVKGESVVSQGTGFIFWKKGILVTCNHIVKGKFDTIYVRFSDVENASTEYLPAEILVQDHEHDIAILKMEDSKREPLAQSEMKIMEGMPVIVSGYPLNLSSLTTHQGIISAIIKDEIGNTVYMIDGTINPGNSGGPLMDKNGNVIGVVNATRREEAVLLRDVSDMQPGVISLHGIDLVLIYHALIKNLQLGMGYAVPLKYIPSYK